MTTQPETAVGNEAAPEGNADKPSLEDRFAAHVASEPEEEQQDELADEGGDLPLEDAGDDTPDEAAELPPIKPPASWSAEEQAAFAGLPRELQETVQRREAEREKFVQSKSQEAARVKAQVETQALGEVRQLAETQAQRLQMLLPEIPQKPSAYLQVENPQQWAIEQETYDWAVAQHQAVQQEIEQASRLAQAAQQEHTNRVYAENVAILQEQFPEYLGSDPNVRAGLRDVATELGFTPEELADPSAREILALRKVQDWKNDAAAYRKLMASRMEGVRAGKQAPKLTRPGQAQGRETISAQRMAQDRAAMRNGDNDAAARVFGRHL